jgi:hypothetical protein
VKRVTDASAEAHIEPRPPAAVAADGQSPHSTPILAPDVALWAPFKLMGVPSK